MQDKTRTFTPAINFRAVGVQIVVFCVLLARSLVGIINFSEKYAASLFILKYGTHLSDYREESPRRPQSKLVLAILFCYCIMVYQKLRPYSVESGIVGLS